MLPGYNHNIRYQDKVFHVQTEDSGMGHASITTHIFLNGRVIEMRQASYQDVLELPALQQHILELMQTQHKAMLKELTQGKLDNAILAAMKPLCIEETQQIDTPTSAIIIDSIFDTPTDVEKSFQDVMQLYFAHKSKTKTS